MNLEYLKELKIFGYNYNNFDLRSVCVWAGQLWGRIGWRKENNELFIQYWNVFIVVLAYWVVSTLYNYVNRTVISHQIDFEAPVFITWSHCVFTAVTCLVLTFCVKFIRLIRFGNVTCLDAHIHWKCILQTLPVSLTYVGMITLHVLCLNNVGFSLYYLIRAWTSLVALGFTLTVLGSKVSYRAVICCGLFTIGWLIGLDHEGLSSASVTLQKLCFSVLSTVSIALNAVFTSWTLPRVRNSVWMLVLYSSLNSSVLLLPFLIWFREWPNMSYITQFKEPEFQVWMLIGGVCGFMMALITALQIKITSAITHVISDTVKYSMQAIANIWLFYQPKSMVWWVSNLTILLSSAAYAKVQQQDMKKAHARKLSLNEISVKGKRAKTLDCPEKPEW